MSKDLEKLSRDLIILEAMADEMEEYLRSDVLFWQMMKGGLPKLTIGGYLMRQHRLLILRDLLEEQEQAQLDAAVFNFNQVLIEKIVLLEKKGHWELEARIRQWGEFLKDLDWDKNISIAGYQSSVETRAMISAIIDKLEMPPYQLDPRIKQKVRLLDGNLRRHWKKGEFVWPEEWKVAYPSDEYWWLYGKPK